MCQQTLHQKKSYDKCRTCNKFKFSSSFQHFSPFDSKCLYVSSVLVRKWINSHVKELLFLLLPLAGQCRCISALCLMGLFPISKQTASDIIQILSNVTCDAAVRCAQASSCLSKWKRIIRTILCVQQWNKSDIKPQLTLQDPVEAFKRPQVVSSLYFWKCYHKTTKAHSSVWISLYAYSIP